MLMVQVAPTATVVPQLLVCVKSPLAAMEEMFNGAVPGLFKNTCCSALTLPTSWEVNVRLAGEKLIAGAVTPMPVNAIVCGLPVALSASTIEPLRAPAAVGLNLMPIEQVAAAASVVPQVFV